MSFERSFEQTVIFSGIQLNKTNEFQHTYNNKNNLNKIIHLLTTKNNKNFL